MSKKLFGWIAGIEIMTFATFEGSALTLGWAAPVIFSQIPSKDQAGRVFGGILSVWFWIGLACTIILTATSLLVLTRIKPLSRLLLVRALTSVLMTVLVVIFGFLMARITTIQNSLTKPIDDYPTNTGVRLEFDNLHSLSTNIVSGAILLGFAWLILSVLSTVKLSDKQGEVVQPEVTPDGTTPNLQLAK